ncbi:MAG: phosphoribosylglycinamide formyltransferase [Bacteroidetes bacterium]|nr:MAG: phosphoribosylglycinamide formyltransferase [Bacteroidota bacterium]
MKRVAILSSGSGSNAQALIEYFEACENIHVVYVGSNRPKAEVLERADRAEVNNGVFSKSDLLDGTLKDNLDILGVDWVLLAGFLLKIPGDFCNRYKERILNIHPSLLPKFGGKGMFGMNVHKAVYEAREKESGMTIHFVNESYDEGAIVFQGRVDISNLKSPEEIASKVLKLEHKYYPKISEELITLAEE